MCLDRLDVECVVEFKTVHGKDHPDEVAESLGAYGGSRPHFRKSRRSRLLMKS